MRKWPYGLVCIAVPFVFAAAACGGVDDVEGLDERSSFEETAAGNVSISQTCGEDARQSADDSLVAVAAPRMHYRADGAKVSSQTYRVRGQTSYKEVTCTSSCNGNFCSGSGCDVWGGGCSTFSCSQGCAGSCTKTVKEAEFELEP